VRYGSTRLLSSPDSNERGWSHSLRSITCFSLIALIMRYLYFVRTSNVLVSAASNTSAKLCTVSPRVVADSRLTIAASSLEVVEPPSAASTGTFKPLLMSKLALNKAFAVCLPTLGKRVLPCNHASVFAAKHSNSRQALSTCIMQHVLALAFLSLFAGGCSSLKLKMNFNLETRSTPERFASFSKKNVLDVGGKAVLALGGAALLTNTKRAVADTGGIPIRPLPYSASALEPFLDTRTMEIHHDKHYGGYVTKVNALVKGGSLSDATLLQMMDDAYSSKNKNEGLYNVAAQSWNHEFYFAGLSPSGGGAPKEGTKAAVLVKKSFGDYLSFRKEFASAGGSLFGSGWVWLVLNQQGKLDIVKTSNALNPLQTTKGAVPLLTCDVWEHAYYLLHQNRRQEYVDAFLDHLINWDFVESNIPPSVKVV